MKNIILLFFLIVPYKVCYCQDFDFSHISKEVSKYQYKTHIMNKKKNKFHQLRLKLYEQNKFDFINKSDTLFFLESFHYETGEYYGRIWNNHNFIQYIYLNDTFNLKPNKIFTSYMIELVKNWNIENIRLEEKQNSNMLPNNPLTATRIIISHNKLLIDCIKFKDFFKLERDRE